jgi:polysaccharide pyruvyl transferase CsaB
MLSDLRAVEPDIQAVVVSGDPSRTMREHGVDAVGWKDIEALISAARQAQAIVVGGGGLYHDYWPIEPDLMLTPWHSGIGFLDTIRQLALLFDKPFMTYAVGVGPLHSDLAKDLTRQAFSGAACATVRDQDSLNLVRQLGVTNEIIVTADAAFGLEPAGEEGALAFRREWGDRLEPPVLAVSLRHWNFAGAQETWEQEIIAVLDRWMLEAQGSIAFFPFQRESITEYEDDWQVSKRVADALQQRERVAVIPDPLEPAQAVAALSSCNIALGMRLHSVLFAFMAGIPVVGLAYDPKVTAHMAAAGLEDFAVSQQDWHSEAIWQALTKARAKSEKLSAKLAKHVAALESRSRKTAELLIDLIEKRQIVSEQGSASVATEMAIERVMVAIDLRRDLRRLGEESGEARSALESETEQLRSKLAQAEQENQELSSKLMNAERLAEEGAKDLEKSKHLAEKLSGELVNSERLAKELSSDLVYSERLVEEAARALSSRDHQIGDLEALTENLNHRLESLEQANIGLRQDAEQLAAIKAGISWNLLRVLRRLRLLAVPPQSGREQIWLGIIRGRYPRGLRQGVRRALNRWLLSPSAYVHDRYRRKRRQMMGGSSLSSVRYAAERGLVSVVLPAYNGELYVREAVQSLLDQSYSKWELIAVDDGSTDATGDILDEYATADERIRVIHQENRKIAASLSRGFSVADGEYLTWTSCDNRMKPDFLQRMVDCLERHPDWDMAYANLDIIDQNGQPLLDSYWYGGYQRPAGSQHIHLPGDPRELNVWPNNYVGAAFLYRRRVAGLLGEYSLHRYTMEDYDYWMRVNGLLTMRHVDFAQSVYEYRFHTESLTSKDQELQITENRPKLMVFDNFRRDFYLSPMLWAVDSDGDEEAEILKRNLADSIRKSGQILMSDLEITPDNLLHPNLPLVRVHIARGPGTPKDDLPQSSMQALVLLDPSVAASANAESWDIAILNDGAETLPRGWTLIENPHHVFLALDIRARAKQTAHMEDIVMRPVESELKASVVICTYRRGEEIAASIASVSKQSLSEDDYELIVINNDPTDEGIRTIIADLRNRIFDGDERRLQLLECPLPGLSFARNVGLAAARGEIVCFLDDDAVAEEDWLAALWQAFDQSPSVGVVGGNIQVSISGIRPKWLKPNLESYWSGLQIPHQTYTPVGEWWQFPWGANWAARRKALREIGGFRTSYGRKGDDFSGGEEIVAASLIQRLGYQIGLEPRARVEHVIDPDRVNKSHVRKTVHSGRTTWYLAQRDLYLPHELGFTQGLLRIIQLILALPKRSRRMAPFVALAELNVEVKTVARIAADQLRRFRRSIPG